MKSGREVKRMMDAQKKEKRQQKWGRGERGRYLERKSEGRGKTERKKKRERRREREEKEGERRRESGGDEKLLPFFCASIHIHVQLMQYTFNYSVDYHIYCYSK